MATDDRIGLLFWEMTLKDEEFKSKIKDSKSNLEKLDTDSKKSLGSVAKGFAAVAAAAVATAAGLVTLAADSAQAAAEQKILADSIGATTAEIVGLDIAAQKLGVDSGQVLDKMREFGGIDEFKKLADDVKNAGDAQDQLNKAVEIFGGEGAKILPVLQQGSEGLKEFEEQALKTGNALSPEQTKAATEAWSDFQDLQLETKGATLELGIALSGILPILTSTVRGVREIGDATFETIDGFNIWIDEILGIEDATSKATTAEEILALKMDRATAAAKRQANALQKLEDQEKKTFSSEIFTQINIANDLERIRKELGLTEEGFRKVSSTVTSALGRNESALQIIKDLQETQGKLFISEDFEKFGKLDLTIFDDLDKEQKQVEKMFDNLTKTKVKFLEDIDIITDPGNVASTSLSGLALSGSQEEQRLLNRSQQPIDKLVKEAQKQTKVLEKLEAF